MGIIDSQANRHTLWDHDTTAQHGILHSLVTEPYKIT
jgi:hypothetical protein